MKTDNATESGLNLSRAVERIKVTLKTDERMWSESFLDATWRIEYGGVLTILDNDGRLIASYAPGRWLDVVMG